MQGPVDIRPQDLRIVRDILSGVLPDVACVYVFGSRAKWTSKDSSDLDLAIDANRPLTPSEVSRMSDAFEESDLSYKVDVVDMHSVSDRFRAIIEDEKTPLPSGWPTRQLTEVASLLSGGTPSKQNPEYWGGSIPWLTPKDMSDFTGATADSVTKAAIGNGTRLAPAGSIFIAVRGMSLHNEIRIVRSDQPLAFNQDIKAIVPTNIDSKFLYYALTARKSHLLSVVESAGHGTGVLPTDRLAGLGIDIPSKAEQHRIASLLASLDDKIELNRRTNETLEAMGRAVFRDWFVDFGPTRAKMEGREPYLALDLWALFPDRLDEEGKPEGWRVGKLIDICELKRGYDLPTARRNPGPYPIVSSSGISGYHDSFMVSNSGVVTGRYGTIGEVYYINQSFWPLNTSLYVCDFKGNPSRYVVYALRGLDFRKYSDKAAIPGINRNHLHETKVVLAPQSVRTAFQETLEPIWAQQETNHCESHTLTSLRDLLLPKLISGEIRVRDAEGMVGQVA